MRPVPPPLTNKKPLNFFGFFDIGNPFIRLLMANDRLFLAYDTTLSSETGSITSDALFMHFEAGFIDLRFKDHFFSAQFGLSWSITLNVKSDTPTTVDFVQGGGNYTEGVIRRTSLSTYSYSYLALALGGTYYLPFWNIQLSPYFRLPIAGNYTNIFSSAFELISTDSDNFSTLSADTSEQPGQVGGTLRGAGFMAMVGKEWLFNVANYQMGLGLNFIYVVDFLTLEGNHNFGESFTNTYLGIAVSASLDWPNLRDLNICAFTFTCRQDAIEGVIE